MDKFAYFMTFALIAYLEDEGVLKVKEFAELAKRMARDKETGLSPEEVGLFEECIDMMPKPILLPRKILKRAMKKR